MSFNHIALVLGKPLVAVPGELFWYNSGLSHVLSALIFEVTGQSLLSFARDALFDPLDIRFVRWNQDRAGVTFGGTQLHVTPRDLAKIGRVYVNEGIWCEELIVSS